MARVALVCPGDTGHVLAMASVARALRARDHSVEMLTPLDLDTADRLLDVPHRSLPEDRVQMSRSRVVSAIGAIVGFREMLRWFKFNATITLLELPAAVEEGRPDALVIDQAMLAGGSVADRLHVPFATLIPSIPQNSDVSIPPVFTGWRYRSSRLARVRNRLAYAAMREFLRPVVREINDHRSEWGLAPLMRFDDAWSPAAQLSQLSPSLDFPRDDPPPNFRYVGPLGVATSDVDTTFPWDALDGRPLVYASMGTVGTVEANIKVYSRIITACRDLDVQLVVGLGHLDSGDAATTLGQLARSTDIIVDFAPQRSLLDRAAVLVTHGGVNSVLEALARGVPIVALPRGGDQHACARRLERARVGVVGSFRRTKAAELRTMIERALDPDLAARAREIGDELTSLGGPDAMAQVVEETLLANSHAD